MRMVAPPSAHPHQTQQGPPRPPLMMSMTQPPPVSMQGIGNMGPMMPPAGGMTGGLTGGMAVINQAMTLADDGQQQQQPPPPQQQQQMQAYHPHHHPHHHPAASHHPPSHHPSPASHHPSAASHHAPSASHHAPSASHHAPSAPHHPSAGPPSAGGPPPHHHSAAPPSHHPHPHHHHSGPRHPHHAPQQHPPPPVAGPAGSSQYHNPHMGPPHSGATQTPIATHSTNAPYQLSGMTGSNQMMGPPQMHPPPPHMPPQQQSPAPQGMGATYGAAGSAHHHPHGGPQRGGPYQQQGGYHPSMGAIPAADMQPQQPPQQPQQSYQHHGQSYQQHHMNKQQQQPAAVHHHHHHQQPQQHTQQNNHTSRMPMHHNASQQHPMTTPQSSLQQQPHTSPGTLQPSSLPHHKPHQPPPHHHHVPHHTSHHNQQQSSQQLPNNNAAPHSHHHHHHQSPQQAPHTAVPPQMSSGLMHHHTSTVAAPHHSSMITAASQQQHDTLQPASSAPTNNMNHSAAPGVASVVSNTTTNSAAYVGGTTKPSAIATVVRNSSVGPQSNGSGPNSNEVSPAPQQSSSSAAVPSVGKFKVALPSTSSCTSEGAAAATNKTEDNGCEGASSSSSTSSSSADEANSSSSKEKTPMCLVNELARYNKIQHQYCLTDEKGPAHKKAFTVTLRLGPNETYNASGPSIKKAQHSAAEIALKDTTYKHPPPKPARVPRQSKLTPTVELNALAMKRGEATSYSFIEGQPPPPPPRLAAPGCPYGPPPLPPLQPGLHPNLRAVYNQKYLGRGNLWPVFLVSLKVGAREFVGEGSTAQQAKHNAAAKALRVVKGLPLPQEASPTVQSDLSELDPNADLKSPISIVHELALRRSLTVQFEVVGESGPPHMRTFLTICAVGEIKCQGEGASKKISKKRSAELMLEELRKLPPVQNPSPARTKRKPVPKKKSRNLVKEQATPEYGQGVNPISRLIQIQQSKKEKEPVYTLLAERGVPRRREFVMQVEVGSVTAQGTGPNKKLAKRAAAENILQILGYAKPAPQPIKSAIKGSADTGTSSSSSSEADTKPSRKVTFQEECKTESTSTASASSGASVNAVLSSSPTGNQSSKGASSGPRQLVPGLIVMGDATASTVVQTHQLQTPPPVSEIPKMSQTKETARNVSVVAKPADVSSSPPAPTDTSSSSSNGSESTGKALANGSVMVHGSNPTSASSPQGEEGTASASCTVSSAASGVVSTTSTQEASPDSPEASTSAMTCKEQLFYLANMFGLVVQFTDFPKSSKSQYLSLVSLNTSPPHVCHGSGKTIEEAHNKACMAALNSLSEMGLDHVTPQ